MVRSLKIRLGGSDGGACLAQEVEQLQDGISVASTAGPVNETADYAP